MRFILTKCAKLPFPSCAWYKRRDGLVDPLIALRWSPGMVYGDNVSEYLEIDDPAEILRLNNSLAGKLESVLKHVEERTIGAPPRKFSAPVRFESEQGEGLLYWSTVLSDDKTYVRNRFGHGSPGTAEVLGIEMQFNLPIVTFSRRHGGLFLQKSSSNTVVLAHRGTATKGNGSLPRAAVIAELASMMQEARTGKGKAKVLLIGELESTKLIQEIGAFSLAFRNAARNIKRRDKTR
jgi:hypothetical protein